MVCFISRVRPWCIEFRTWVWRSHDESNKWLWVFVVRVLGRQAKNVFLSFIEINFTNHDKSELIDCFWLFSFGILITRSTFSLKKFDTSDLSPSKIEWDWKSKAINSTLYFFLHCVRLKSRSSLWLKLLHPTCYCNNLLESISFTSINFIFRSDKLANSVDFFFSIAQTKWITITASKTIPKELIKISCCKSHLSFLLSVEWIRVIHDDGHTLCMEREQNGV